MYNGLVSIEWISFFVANHCPNFMVTEPHLIIEFTSSLDNLVPAFLENLTFVRVIPKAHKFRVV